MADLVAPGGGALGLEVLPARAEFSVLHSLRSLLAQAVPLRGAPSDDSSRRGAAAAAGTTSAPSRTALVEVLIALRCFRLFCFVLRL